MRADFLGHATLLIRQGELTLLTDPWWEGPAYRGQWYPYPIPVPERYDLSKIDAVYISHAHEDHLHRDTLTQVLRQSPSAMAVIPERYDTQMRDYLRRIGFQSIREVPSGTSFTLRKARDAARLTIVTHLDDSMLAVEAGNEVLLNVNDALHSTTRERIDVYCRYLRRRLPRIDYLFCGFGGASYFPNCFRVQGKDDAAVAAAREQFFLRNVAQIANGLEPRHLIPFAAHFILLDKRMWWISERRLKMEPPAQTLRRLSPATPVQFHDLQPGDFIANGKVHASPPPPVNPEAARTAVLARYAPRQAHKPLDPEAFGALVNQVRSSVNRHSNPADLDALVQLWDYPSSAIRVRVRSGSAEVTSIAATDLQYVGADVILETRSDLVSSTTRSPFGRDLITIGYAGLVRLRSREVLASNPQDRLLNLLAPLQPRWRDRLRQHPYRTISFVLGDPSMRHDFKKRLLARVGIQSAQRAEPSLYAISDWATIPE